MGIGVVAALAVRDGDLVRTRPVWAAAVVLAVLQGVALARFGGVLDWSTVAAWGYAGVFAVVGMVGAWGWLASLRARASRS